MLSTETNGQCSKLNNNKILLIYPAKQHCVVKLNNNEYSNEFAYETETDYSFF